MIASMMATLTPHSHVQRLYMSNVDTLHVHANKRAWCNTYEYSNNMYTPQKRYASLGILLVSSTHTTPQVRWAWPVSSRPLASPSGSPILK